ncbi:MAG TPA: hypothetical protein VF789_15610 [Thermoanaerobaculia bacterium]
MMRHRILGLLALGLSMLTVQAHALPPFFEKPITYRSMLVTNDNQSVSDVDFAKLVAKTQMNLRNVPREDFTFLGSFTQCYGGGFITELGRQGVTRYGGNSASTYFETASYHGMANRSYYPYAWATMADPLGGAKRTDEWITWKAYDALDPTKPMLRAIPKNPKAAFERAQYRSDRNGVPQPLGAAKHNFAVIWVGKPRMPHDYNDVHKLYTLLTVTYGYKAADIQILWANGGDPVAGDGWMPTGKAEWPDLQAAFAKIENWIKAKPAMDTSQVFFYSGDHGNADFPVTLTVEPTAVGMPLTDLNTGYAGSGRHIFLGGAGTNVYLLTEQTANRPLKALSFGDDFQNMGSVFTPQYASPTAIIYFSVDNASFGLPTSELGAERAAGELQGPNVYSASDNSNRQTFHGRRNFGLVTGANSDEMNDFVVRDMTLMLHPQTGLATRPVFFTNDQDSRIWVHDPARAGGQPKTYVYYDFNTDYPNAPPRLVDALAMVVNLGRRDAAGKLVFNKQQDYILLSVGRNEPNNPWKAYKPCDIIRFGGGANDMMWASCNFLGLDPMKDNVDGLDIGAGSHGQPISFDQEQPWPGSEYPNQPYPGNEPWPNYPLPPDPYEDPYGPGGPGWPMQ